MSCKSLLIEGRLPETVHRRSKEWRPATVARNRRLTREARGTARQALRPGCEELAARVAEDNSADGSAAPGHKSPRWSAERRASRVMGRKALRFSAWPAA